jgi:peptide deformylase
MKKVIVASVFLLIIFGAKAQTQRFTDAERSLITTGGKKDILRVLQITNEADAKILRGVSADINLRDEALPQLIDRMMATVKDPANTGVGIAAPQIGINKNVILVQRFDKQGEPIEAYLNPKFRWKSALLRKGAEGCLSIADIRGDVLRSYTIELTYFDMAGKFHDEVIEGFTAVIFQHETDHLLGILFTDRLEQQNAQDYQPMNGEVNFFLEHKLKRN